MLFYSSMSQFDTQFHAVYLLTSADPAKSTLTYIGYTVNPERRLRQHNGEITAGAFRTQKVGRPWRMELCIFGFPNKHVALQFEWNWQHPHLSCGLLRAKCQEMKGNVGQRWAYKAKLAILHELLQLSPWNKLSMTIFFIGHGKERYDSTLMHMRGSTPNKVRIKRGNYYAVPELNKLIKIAQGSFEQLRAHITGFDFLSDDESHSEEFVQNELSNDRQGTPDFVVEEQLNNRDLNCSRKILESDGEDFFSLIEGLTQAPKEEVFLYRSAQNNEKKASNVHCISSEGISQCLMASEMKDNICCYFCSTIVPFNCMLTCVHPCTFATHLLCLSDWFQACRPVKKDSNNVYEENLYDYFVPAHAAPCPLCSKTRFWSEYVALLKRKSRRCESQQSQDEKTSLKYRKREFRKRVREMQNL